MVFFKIIKNILFLFVYLIFGIVPLTLFSKNLGGQQSAEIKKLGPWGPMDPPWAPWAPRFFRELPPPARQMIISITFNRSVLKTPTLDQNSYPVQIFYFTLAYFSFDLSMLGILFYIFGIF